jgi:RecA-family ATPase
VSAPRRFEAVAFEDIRRESTEWLLPGRIPIGGVTILGGDPGLGKSQWTCLLAAQLSRGELGPPAATLMLTAEDDPSRTIKPRLEAAEANVSLIHVVRALSSEGFELPDDVVELDRLVAETNAKLVVIDPVSAHLCGKTDSFKDADVRRALRPLSDIGERHQCAILPVMHLNKGSGMPAIYRLSGSVAFSGAPRSILFFARDPDDPDGDAGKRRALSHDKCNLGPQRSTLLYDIEPVTVPARGDEPAVRVSRLEFRGKSNRRGNDLLAFSDGEERSAIEEATDFLQDALANGPVEKTEIVKRSRADGHSD